MRKTIMQYALLVAAAVAAGSALAAGDAAAGRDKATACSTCHGIDGNGRIPLAGKDQADLLARMKAFKQGEGGNPIMRRIMAELTARDLADLAAWFSGQTRK
ncbi:MAG TPA: c-type cytochrome [Gammaproteobacteria bacterium]|nr:c-type cytochrome [Gammaproteobacteria bacterium]